MEKNADYTPPSSIYKLLATNLLQIQKCGNYVKGYIDGKEKLALFMKQYTDLTKTKFIIRTSTCKKSKVSSNGDVRGGTSCTRYGQTDRIYWEFNNRNLHVPFTGLPFLTNSSQVKHCQHGSQYYKLKSEKDKKKIHSDFNHWPAGHSTSTESNGLTRQKHTKPSKKRNCPAYMYIREVVLFPDFAINPELLTAPKHTLRKEKSKMVNKLKQTMLIESLTSIHRFFLEIPLPEAHSDHPSDENISSMRVMNPFIKSKIDELLLFGSYEKRHIELIMQDYVKEALFKNGNSLGQSVTHPTLEEIRDYIYFSSLSAPTVVEVQTKEAGSDEIVKHSRATVQNEMEKRVKELKLLVETCSDSDTLQVAKMQMKAMIDKIKVSAASYSSRQLRKRSFDTVEKSIHNQKRRKTVQNAFQNTPLNSNSCISCDAEMPSNQSVQNQMQFHPKEMTTVPVHPAEENMRFSDTSMLATFSRLMESDQDILPSLVDHVIADSHFRPTPSYCEYSQFQNR